LYSTTPFTKGLRSVAQRPVDRSVSQPLQRIKKPSHQARPVTSPPRKRSPRRRSPRSGQSNDRGNRAAAGKL